MIETNNCPLCGASSTKWLKKNGFELSQCNQCGHCFCAPMNAENHVREVYSDNYFQDSVEGYSDYLGEEAIQSASARHYINRLRPFLPSTPTVLDFGAACGFFLNEFQKAGWNVSGIEPNATMRNIGKQKFGLEIRDLPLEQASSKCSLDLISAIQVISHLIAPLEFIVQCHERLKPGGYLLIETWDRNSVAAKLFGSTWHELNPPSVLQWFSRASLREVVCSRGYQLVEHGLPRKSIQLGRAVNMLRHSWKESTVARCLSFPLALVPKHLTIPYRLGDAFWMLFQKKS